MVTERDVFPQGPWQHIFRSLSACLCQSRRAWPVGTGPGEILSCSLTSWEGGGGHTHFISKIQIQVAWLNVYPSFSYHRSPSSVVFLLPLCGGIIRNIEFIPLKKCTIQCFLVYSKLYSHHRYLILEIFSTPERNPDPSPWQPLIFLSFSMDFLIPGIARTWDRTTWGFLWLVMSIL